MRMRSIGATLSVAFLAGCGRYYPEINDAAAAGNLADVNTADDEGRTPLGEATRPYDADEVAFLDILRKGWRGERESIARLLREHGARE